MHHKRQIRTMLMLNDGHDMFRDVFIMLPKSQTAEREDTFKMTTLTKIKN